MVIYIFIKPKDLSKSLRQYSSHSFYPSKMKMEFMPTYSSFYCRKAINNSIGLFYTSFRVSVNFEWLLWAIYINNIKTKYIPMDFVTMRYCGAYTSGL